jgi:hypothetical protein
MIKILELLKPLPCEISLSDINESLVNRVKVLHSSLVANKVVSAFIGRFIVELKSKWKPSLADLWVWIPSASIVSVDLFNYCI